MFKKEFNSFLKMFIIIVIILVLLLFFVNNETTGGGSNNSFKLTKLKRDINKVIGKEDMCYFTADKVINKLGKKIIKNEFNNKEEAINFLDTLDIKKDMVIRLELKSQSIKTFSQKEKNELIKKYNLNMDRGFLRFAFKKENIRIYNHSFNIFIINGKPHFGQSWEGVQKYHMFNIKGELKPWLVKLFNKLETLDGILSMLEPNYNKATKDLLKDLNALIGMVKKEKIKKDYNLIFDYSLM